MPTWPEPAPGPILSKQQDSTGSLFHQQPKSRTDLHLSSTDFFNTCDLCHLPITAPGRGRWKYHQKCVREGYRQRDQENRAAKQASIRSQLGADLAKALDATGRWIRRQPDINSRYFLNRPTALLRVAAGLDASPFSPGTYEDWVHDLLHLAWSLLLSGDEVQAKTQAETLSQIVQYKPCRHPERVSLVCHEIIADTGLEVNAAFGDTLRSFEGASTKLVVGWHQQKDHRRFVTALFRQVNYLRAYPWISPDTQHEALLLLDVASRLLALSKAHSSDVGASILKREIAHRRYQFLIKAGRLKEATREIDVIRDLAEAVGSPSILVHSLTLAAPHMVIIGRLSEAQDCLKLAKSKLTDCPTVVAQWALLRAEVETSLQTGGTENQYRPAIERFLDAWVTRPCAYQRRIIKQWCPSLSWKPLSARKTIVTVSSEPMIELFLKSD